MAEGTWENTPKQARDLFKKGEDALKHGNLDYAIDMFQACLELAPGQLEVRAALRAAEVQMNQGKKTGRLSRMFHSMKDLPRLTSGQAQLKAGKAREAMATAEAGLRDDPLNKGYLKLLGQAADAAGLPDVAIQTFEFARERYPDEMDVLKRLGTLYRKVDRTEDSRLCFEHVYELRPNDPDALKALKDATALESIARDGWRDASEGGKGYRGVVKDLKEAARLERESKAVQAQSDLDIMIEDMQKKIAADPENPNYRRNLATLYVKRNMLDEAFSVLEEAQKMSGSRDPQIDAEISVVRARQFDREIDALKKAGNTAAAEAKAAEKDTFIMSEMADRVQRYPNDLQFRFEYGVLLFEHGQVNEAIQQFQLSQRNPKNRSRSLYFLALCFEQKSQYDLATEQLEKAASEIHAMDQMKKDILYEIGQIAEKIGNPQKAAGYYKDIYQVDIGYKDVAEKVEKLYGNP
ncbi:MAG: tetratricopeptide repeat protein [Kiritimatiellae bacterium]|nr:tetratricopeptide repeat protein [Kiritimatiellia bacterium]